MELNDMKTLWDAYDRKLDTSIRLTTRLLNAAALKKAQTAMTRLVRLWQIECVLNLAAVVWLGWFESNHFTQPRFLVPALVLHAGAIALLITYARRILAVRRIDYAQPIMAIQKALESVRIAEIHATKWTLLLAPIAWTPFLIVAFKGLFNVDAYTTFSTAWLAGNVLFGIVVVLIERWVSWRYAERMQRSPRLQRWMRDLNGYNLKAAMSFLRSAAEFEEEAHETA